jgi:truncated hemoglobin YjbI
LSTRFEQLGGEVVLRRIIDRFVDRAFDDFIIGFFFAGKDRDRIKTHEYEHAAAVLGCTLPYTGRALVPLHQGLKINGGQFRRRLAILRQELEAAGVAPEIMQHWLDKDSALQNLFIDGTDCV